MSVDIHPSAIVDPKAELADGVEIGPYAEEHGLAAACRVLLNLNEFSFVD